MGSCVAPWLYRACIKRGGRPGVRSDDENAHPCETGQLRIVRMTSTVFAWHYSKPRASRPRCQFYNSARPNRKVIIESIIVVPKRIASICFCCRMTSARQEAESLFLQNSICSLDSWLLSGSIVVVVLPIVVVVPHFMGRRHLSRPSVLT